MPREPRALRIRLDHLREWRHFCLLSQDELAESSGVAKSTISNLENGNHSANLATVGRLARGLGITRQALLSPPPEAESLPTSSESI